MTSISYTAEELLAQARELTGIDIIDTDALKPLSVLLHSLNTESQLHEAGAIAMEQRLLRLLSNRLRMQRDFTTHPEIAEQTIDAPIVICGMARTGSTKMQKLLSASGDFNWLPYWQSYNPSSISGEPSEPLEQRIKEAEDYCRWFDNVSPEAKYGHAQEAHEPDEESYMLEQSLRTPCFLGWTEMPGYLQWLAGDDMAAQFHYLKDLLKYLQWQGVQDPNKRWVLKCPLYFGMEPLLLSVFPDAKLVMTHRHPKATMPSSCKLLEAFHKPFSAASISYDAYLQGSAAQIAQHLTVRKQSDISFLDLDFEQIVGKVDKVCEQVYRYAGLTLSDESKQHIVAWHNNNPQNKKGVHKYSLEDFGFSDTLINDVFADYIALIT